MLFRGHSICSSCFGPGRLNLSCESNAFQGCQQEGLDLIKREGLNLSCESNAFQGSSVIMNCARVGKVLISLARVMLFRVRSDESFQGSSRVLISLARVMLFRVNNEH